MITIIPANSDHAGAIHTIETASFSDPWSIASISAEIARPNSVFLIAISENIVVGYVSMRHIIDEGHISNIAVTKAYRQKGVGSLLIDALIKESKRHGITGLTLEVRVSNHAALHLYKKHEFAIEGYRKNYYTLPTEDAAIMWLNIKKPWGEI